MVRRYFCEYCNKKFVDHLTHRKNHLNGVVHQRNKKLHYANFKDPQEQLQEDSCKMPCRTFFATGECKFGMDCRFSHLTEERRQELRDKMSARRRAEGGHAASRDELSAAVRSVQSRRRDQEEGNVLRVDHLFSFAVAGRDLPALVAQLPAIPPSLLPATRADMCANFTDWG